MSTRRTHPVRAVLAGVLLFALSAFALLTVVIPLVLGAQSYTVLTGSMQPSIPPGSLVAVRATPVDDIRVGDIITYQLHSGEPEVVTHRVVGVGVDGTGERLLTTQGDANNVADAEPVREVQIRGVLVYAMPWVGYANIWATPMVKSIVVGVAGGAAILWGLWLLFQDARRRRRIARATSAAVAVGALALPLALWPAAGASASSSTDFLQLSADGVSWSTGPELTLIRESARLSPGDAVSVDLWVRNASGDRARFTIASSWRPHDSTDPADAALADALGVETTVARTALEPGASIRVPIRLTFASTADLASRNASADLALTVVLTQSGDAASPGGPLPGTGGELPVAALVTAGVLLVGGTIVLVSRGIRRNRRIPRDATVSDDDDQA